MTGPDRDRRVRSDRPGPAAEAPATRPRTAAAAFAAVVFVGSVLPVPTAPSGGSADGPIGRVVDGVGGALPVEVGLTAPFHFLGYAVLAALLLRAAGSASEGNRGRRIAAVAVAAAASTAFGFGIELVQAPIPWRSFAWSDAALNAAGAVVGAGVSAMTTRLYALGRFLR